MMKEDAKAEILVPKQPVVGLLLSSVRRRRRRKNAAGDEEDAPSRSSTCLSLSRYLHSSSSYYSYIVHALPCFDLLQLQ